MKTTKIYHVRSFKSSLTSPYFNTKKEDAEYTYIFKHGQSEKFY